MKPMIVGKNNPYKPNNDPKVTCYGRSSIVNVNVPAQTPADKANHIDDTLKRVKQNINSISSDKLDDSIDSIVRAVVGRAVVGARTGADRKILVIQEIGNAIEKIRVSMATEQDEKMKNFYKNLNVALLEKQESVYEVLNPAQIAVLQSGKTK